MAEKYEEKESRKQQLSMVQKKVTATDDQEEKLDLESVVFSAAIKWF